MAAEKTLSFKIDISGVSNEANELAKIEYQLKNIKKEKQELDKLAAKGFLSNEDKAKLAAYNKEIERQVTIQKELKKVMDSAPDSLDRMRAKLISLKDAYGKASEAARNNMAPAILKLNENISKAEQAIGVHQRNVGNYPNLMGQAKASFAQLGDTIKESMGNLLTGGAILGGVVLVFNKLKDAVIDTEGGLRLFNTTAQVTKQLFYDIITTGSISMQKLIDATKVAREANEVRVRDRKDAVEIAKIEGEIAEYRFKAADQMLSNKDKLEALNKVFEKHDELITITLRDKMEDLDIVNKMLILRPQETKLLDEQAKIIAEIYQIENRRKEEMRRVQSQRSGILKQERDDRVNALAELFQEAEDIEQKRKDTAKKAKEDQEKEIKDNHKAIKDFYKKKWEIIVNEEKLGNSLMSNVRKLLGIEDSEMGIQSNSKWLEKNKKQIDAINDYEKTQAADTEKKKIDIRMAVLEGAGMGIESGFEAKRNRLQAEMEAELSNTELTEKQKLAIQKKYAKEQQKIDISQAIINGALAITKTFAQLGFTVAGWIAAGLSTAQTAIQVATIKAQKFTTGGKVQGGLQIHPDTSKDNTLVYVKQGETILNQRQVAMLGGSSAMRRIKVPGYADGGYVGQMSPEIASSGFDYNALAKLMHSIDVRLDVNKLNSAQRQVQINNETNRI